MYSRRTTFLIISDTHLASPFPSGVPADLPHIDVLLHCGDLTMTGTVPEYHQALDMLATIPADTKLVIPGNHDLTLDREWLSRAPRRLEEFARKNGVAKWGGSLGDQQWRVAEAVWSGEESRAVREGVTMLKEGRHDVRLKNGALLKVYASPYQPEFCDWAFAYDAHEDRFNPKDRSLSDAANIAVNPVQSPTASDSHPPPPTAAADIDVMITHGPPYGRMDLTSSGRKVGCPHLLAAIARAQPRVHCFGHIHEGWGVERIDWSDGRVPSLDPPSSTLEVFEQAWDAVEDTHAVGKIVGHQAVPNSWGSDWVTLDLCDADGGPVVSGTTTTTTTTTTLVNAAIMDVDYRPVNLPILLFMDLEIPEP